jgi:hypothetical protein
MRSYQKSFNIKSKKIPNLMETKKPVDPGKKDKTLKTVKREKYNLSVCNFISTDNMLYMKKQNSNFFRQTKSKRIHYQ